ncbi:MAG: PHP domain-containing protein, partial [Thermoplasmata archaeon]|nr:PHP domain-containing protein [Thermoplasmata archaeon]
YSDMGDIIGLRISEPIKSRAWEEVIDEIRAQGGIAILPHPFRSHKSVRALAEHCDVVEVFNGRCSIKENAKAKRLAEKLGKPTLGGSDAHVYTEIGKVVNSFDDILQAKKAMDVKMSNSLERTLSYVIRDVKRKKWKNIPRDVAWGLKPR